MLIFEEILFLTPMKKFLFSILAVITGGLTPLSADEDQLSKELLSDLEPEFWTNGNYFYVQSIADTFIDDPFWEGQLENAEFASLHLYAGLSRLYRSDLREETKEHLETACRKSIEEYGESSRLEGLALMGLGRYFGNSDLEKAIGYDKQAVTMIELACGKNAVETAVAEQSLAYHQVLSGNTAEAEKLFKSAEKRFEDGNTCKSLMYARFLTERSILWTMEKDADKAFSDIEKAAALLNSFDDTKTDVVNVETFIYFYGMAVYVCNSFGLWNDAVEFGTENLELMKGAGMDRTADYAANMANIGTAYIFLKDNNRAYEWYQKAKDTYEALGQTADNGYKNVINALNWLSAQ